jgi:hypothetical protein
MNGSRVGHVCFWRWADLLGIARYRKHNAHQHEQGEPYFAGHFDLLLESDAEKKIQPSIDL